MAAKADEAQAPLKGRFNRSWHAVFTRAVTAAGGIGTCSLQGVHAALQELGVAATESQVRELHGLASGQVSAGPGI